MQVNQIFFIVRHVHREIFTNEYYPSGYSTNGHYLTIRPVAQKGYGSIAHEANPNGLQ